MKDNPKPATSWYGSAKRILKEATKISREDFFVCSSGRGVVEAGRLSHSGARGGGGDPEGKSRASEEGKDPALECACLCIGVCVPINTCTHLSHYIRFYL